MVAPKAQPCNKERQSHATTNSRWQPQNPHTTAARQSGVIFCLSPAASRKTLPTVKQKMPDCHQHVMLVKKLMKSRQLDAKHGAFYLLHHTRIGQPPQSGHIYSLAACATRALTGEFPLSTCKKWGQAQCSRPGPHFSLPKVSGYSKNPSISLLRKTALK